MAYSTDSILVGRQILGVEQQDEATVLFCTDKGDVRLHFYPDCCSRAYVYEVEGDLTGKVVTRVDMDVRDDAEEPAGVWTKIAKLIGVASFEPECPSIWGVDVYAGESRLRVKHCNDSNGYYDSWAQFSEVW